VLQVLQGGLVVPRRDGQDVRLDPPDTAAKWLALLDGDQVDREHVADLERQEGAVEGKLVQVAERAGVGLEVLEVVAGLEIDEALGGAQPVEPGLARDAAVVAADDALRHALGKQFAGDGVALDGGGQLFDQDRLAVGQHRLGLAIGPLLVGLAAAVEQLAGRRVGRPAEGVLPPVGVAAFEDERVGGPADLEGRPVFLDDQAELPLAVQERVLAEVGQGVAGQVLLGFRVVHFGRLAQQKVEPAEGGRAGTAVPTRPGRCKRHGVPRRRKWSLYFLKAALARPLDGSVAQIVSQPRLLEVLPEPPNGVVKGGAGDAELTGHLGDGVVLQPLAQVAQVGRQLGQDGGHVMDQLHVFQATARGGLQPALHVVLRDGSGPLHVFTVLIEDLLVKRALATVIPFFRLAATDE
jgi:hypothetical protein